jgi:hypothetical protein
MNQLEKYDEMVKSLTAIATYKLSVEDLEEDIHAIQQEALRALKIAGYDFSFLMNPKNDIATDSLQAMKIPNSTNPNAEA